MKNLKNVNYLLFVKCNSLKESTPKFINLK